MAYVTPFYEDKDAKIPHPFGWFRWEEYTGALHCTYFLFSSAGVVDDFGDLVPAYLPAVLNLKHEGH